MDQASWFEAPLMGWLVLLDMSEIKDVDGKVIKQSVEYERVPIQCNVCHVFGHPESKCHKKLKLSKFGKGLVGHNGFLKRNGGYISAKARDWSVKKNLENSAVSKKWYYGK
ncbi:hypothetical protein LguiA_033989 [Lonicera macranthoides]